MARKERREEQMVSLLTLLLCSTTPCMQTGGCMCVCICFYACVFNHLNSLQYLILLNTLLTEVFKRNQRSVKKTLGYNRIQVDTIQAKR